jgi:tetratricopeptide (TPR) repeat protein
MGLRLVRSHVRVVLLALAIAVQIPTRAPGEPLAEARALNRQAVALYGQGRYAEAEPLLKRALEIRERSLGPDHPDVAESLNNLALLYESRGRSAEAEPLLKRALAIREKSLGPDRPDVARA